MLVYTQDGTKVVTDAKFLYGNFTLSCVRGQFLYDEFFWRSLAIALIVLLKS